AARRSAPGCPGATTRLAAPSATPPTARRDHIGTSPWAPPAVVLFCSLTSSSRACGTVDNGAFAQRKSGVGHVERGCGKAVALPCAQNPVRLSPAIHGVFPRVHAELLTLPRTIRVRSWTWRKVA